MAKILIIDDEEQLRKLLARIIGLEGYEVAEAADCAEGLRMLRRCEPDVVLCDVKLPDGNGVEMVGRIKQAMPSAEVILLTAYGNIPDGVQAIKNGAFDYITKGDDNNKILPLLSRATEKARMQRRLARFEAKLSDEHSFDRIIGSSEALRQAVNLARKVAATDTSVLLTGETGTGKDLLAQAIHNDSARARQPFVAVNCASIPDTLIEAELFGYEEGAFTGARRKGAVGKILQAHGGTLFLDEIGDMPQHLQARLLRVLQERKVSPLGAGKEVAVDVTVISATHKNLKELMARGAFREDLYYRLNGLVVRLPALRERTDLEAVVHRVLQSVAGSAPPPGITPAAMALLARCAWPGNLRQLHNLLRTAAAMRDGAEAIAPAHLPEDFLEELRQGDDVRGDGLEHPAGSPRLQTVALDAMARALRQHEGNVSAAAKALGVSRNTIYRKKHLLPPGLLE